MTSGVQCEAAGCQSTDTLLTIYAQTGKYSWRCWEKHLNAPEDFRGKRE